MPKFDKSEGYRSPLSKKISNTGKSPYVMKGSPMQRNFGIGSPAKYTGIEVTDPLGKTTELDVSDMSVTEGLRKGLREEHKHLIAQSEVLSPEKGPVPAYGAGGMHDIGGKLQEEYRTKASEYEKEQLGKTRTVVYKDDDKGKHASAWIKNEYNRLRAEAHQLKDKNKIPEALKTAKSLQRMYQAELKKTGKITATLAMNPEDI